MARSRSRWVSWRRASSASAAACRSSPRESSTADFRLRRLALAELQLPGGVAELAFLVGQRQREAVGVVAQRLELGAAPQRPARAGRPGQEDGAVGADDRVARRREGPRAREEGAHPPRGGAALHLRA